MGGGGAVNLLCLFVKEGVCFMHLFSQKSSSIYECSQRNALRSPFVTLPYCLRSLIHFQDNSVQIVFASL